MKAKVHLRDGSGPICGAGGNRLYKNVVVTWPDKVNKVNCKNCLRKISGFVDALSSLVTVAKDALEVAETEG